MASRGFKSLPEQLLNYGLDVATLPAEIDINYVGDFLIDTVNQKLTFDEKVSIIIKVLYYRKGRSDLISLLYLSRDASCVRRYFRDASYLKKIEPPKWGESMAEGLYLPTEHGLVRL